MPYPIETKDGIVIADIPDDIKPNDDRIKALVDELRASNTKKYAFTEQDRQYARREKFQDKVAEGYRQQIEGKIQLDPLPTLQDIGQAIKSLPRNYGIMARGATEGATSLVTGITDPINDLINKTLPAEYQQLPPSVGIAKILTNLGLPEVDAQSEAEKIIYAASAGAGSAAVGAGMGAALRGAGAVSKLAGAQTKLQGVGEALAAQPGAQVVGGATAGAASEAAEQEGASPAVQALTGIGAGLVASRAVSPAATAKVATQIADEDFGTLVRKAAAGDKRARQIIANQAAINPEAKTAAEQLDIELPIDIFSDNEQVRAAAGLGRSVAGSYEEAAWRNTYRNVLDKGDEVLEKMGATFAEGGPSSATVSERVKSSLLDTREMLAKETKKAYAEIEAAIPKSSTPVLDNTKKLLATITEEVGENWLTGEEKKLISLVNDPNAKYGALLREKSAIYNAIHRSPSPYANLDTGILKRLEQALAEDQLATVRTLGSPELEQKLIATNAMYGKQKALGNSIVDFFGKDKANSIAQKMSAAISSSAKGETGNFTRLMDSVPPELQKEVLATAIASSVRARGAAEAGSFGLGEFVKTYNGIRNNPAVYKRVVTILGPEADNALSALYSVSKRIVGARQNVLTTGKANQALLEGMTANNLIERVLDSSLGKTLAATGGAAVGGPLGAGVSSGLTGIMKRAFATGEKAKLEAVGKLFRSREFQDLAAQASTTDNITQAQAMALAKSGAFRDFAKAVKLQTTADSDVAWILGAVTQKAAGNRKAEYDRAALPGRYAER
jgi:hypothetical protein